MLSSITPRRLARIFLAIAFSACATTFSVVWVFQTKYSIPEPGFTNYEYSPTAGAMTVGDVLPGSPAGQAGLRSGDRVVAIDGQGLKNRRPFYEGNLAGQKAANEITVREQGPDGGRRGGTS